jgi:hypothetical protein
MMPASGSSVSLVAGLNASVRGVQGRDENPSPVPAKCQEKASPCNGE